VFVFTALHSVKKSPVSKRCVCVYCITCFVFTALHRSRGISVTSPLWILVHKVSLRHEPVSSVQHYQIWSKKLQVFFKFTPKTLLQTTNLATEAMKNSVIWMKILKGRTSICNETNFLHRVCHTYKDFGILQKCKLFFKTPTVKPEFHVMLWSSWFI